ncbi:MAG: FAD-dependent oxidoreductase [Ignavibacteria bacterium]|nr:FAD-dependent oxidoreductase [Ignavibacteria bacterium]
MKRVVIIGGMAAGCKVASRLRRLNSEVEIIILEQLPIVSFGACGMPFFIGGEIDNFEDLMTTSWGTLRSPEFFWNAKKIKVLVETTCTKILPTKNQVEILDHYGKQATLDYDYLVIATGSKPIKPKFPVDNSERISYFHSPLDAKNFRHLAERGKIENAMIIGGGFVGCELAYSVSSLWGIKSTILEKENFLLSRYFDSDFSKLLENIFKRNGIDVKLGVNVEQVSRDGNSIKVETDKGAFFSDFVFLALGVIPNVELARNSGVQLGETGGILVDQNLRTNFENIFAAGDCIQTKNLVTGKPEIFPLGSLANRQGRVVAENIIGIPSKFVGAVGSISLKIFDVIFGVTGLNINGCKDNGLDFNFAEGSFYDRAHYFPESNVLFAKILYEKSSGGLLGLQICGKGEITRYIDVFSILLDKKANYSELLNIEHSYTPPHSSPINPLNYLGGIIQNQEMFDVIPISSDVFLESLSNWVVIDLRRDSELQKMPLEFSCLHIDYDNIQNELWKIPLKESILCVCQKGQRSLEVAIMLKHLGVDRVGYLPGGIQKLKAVL